MAERMVRWPHAIGLHARPASLLVRAVQGFPGTAVFLRKGEREVSASSLLSVLSLGVGQGDAVLIRCQGPGAEEALEQVAAMLEGGLHV